MKQLEIVKKIQKKLDSSLTQAQIGEVISAYRDHILGEISSGYCGITGIGSFIIIKRKSKKGYNMHKKKVVTIPSHYAIKFRPSRGLKSSINA